MAKITAPVKGFNGIVVGVTFTDGVGNTKDGAKLPYFNRHGYTVDGPKAPTDADKAKAEKEAAEKKAAAEKAEADKAEAAKKAAAETAGASGDQK